MMDLLKETPEDLKVKEFNNNNSVKLTVYLKIEPLNREVKPSSHKAASQLKKIGIIHD